MTGSRIFHTIRRLFVIPFVFSFSFTEPTSFVPRYCGGTRLFFLPLSQPEEGDASVAYIHVYHPWPFVAGTVGGYPCSARQSYGSSARVVEYRRNEVSGAEHVLVRTVPESLSGELVLHVAHQRFSRRPGLLQQLFHVAVHLHAQPHGLFHLFPTGACRKETAVGRNGCYGHEQGELYGTQEHRLVGAVSGRGGQRKVGIDISRKSRMDGVCQGAAHGLP